MTGSAAVEDSNSSSRVEAGVVERVKLESGSLHTEDVEAVEDEDGDGK